MTLLALLATGTVATLWFGRPADEPRPGDGLLISSVFDPPSGLVENLFIARDGQIFATVAVDPLARDSAMIRGGPEEEAYRYQRPLYGWLGWLGSAGQGAAVPYALIVLTVFAVTGLVGVIGHALQRSSAHPGWALLVLVTPGVMSNVVFIGPESLGTALVLAGLLVYRRRDGAAWSAIALFAAAGLCRESLLLVPAALALSSLARREIGPAIRLAAGAGPYVSWVVFLRMRTGAWPRGAVDGRLSPIPFGGLLEGVADWVPFTMATIVLLLIIGCAGLAMTRDRQLRLLIGAHLALAAFMGPIVWARAEGTGRTLLPLGALGVWAWAAARSVTTTPGSIEDSPGQRDSQDRLPLDA